MRLAISLGSATALLVAGAFFPGLAAATDTGAECGPDAGAITTDNLDEGTDVVECDLVGEVLDSTDTGLAVAIPEAGVTVEAEGLLPNASPETFEVAVAPDGEVTYEESPSSVADHNDTEDEGTSSDRLGRRTDACDNREYERQATIRRGSYNFYMGDGANPAGLSDAQFREILGLSARTWRDAINPCGAPDITNVRYNYEGQTTRETNMSVSNGVSRCGPRDNYSVIDASNLDNNDDPYVGLNCTWSAHDAVMGPGYQGPEVKIENDIRFNVEDYDFTTNPTASSCSGKWDVQFVATHEMGHSYGIANVDTGSSNYQTMNGSIPDCKLFGRNLGRGDVRGLNEVTP